jgi:hypothetical protein
MVDPDGERKRKVTVWVNEQGVILKQEVKHINYKLKSVKRYKVDWATGAKDVITYDYYDTTDFEVIVQNAQGKVLGKITQKNVQSDIRYEDQAWTPKSWLEAGDEANQTLMDLPTIQNDNLQGREKGNFEGGIDFHIDDEGNILNIRGLEKMNSTSNPERIEIGSLYAILSSQTGAPMPTKLAVLELRLGGIKALEHVENIKKEIKKQTVTPKQFAPNLYKCETCSDPLYIENDTLKHNRNKPANENLPQAPDLPIKY